MVFSALFDCKPALNATVAFSSFTFKLIGEWVAWRGGCIMTWADVHEFLKVLVKDYGSFILGAIGLIFSAIYGGKRFYELMKNRVDHLEQQLESSRQTTTQKQSELDSQAERLATAEKERNSIRAKLARIQLAFSGSDDQNIWMGGPITPPTAYSDAMFDSIPIILVANLKGGVGKSTIATNLVSYFESQHKERVLAIDLDHQGSMSSMLLPEPYNRQGRTAQTVKDLIAGQADPLSIIAVSRPVRGTKCDSRIIDCDSPFANFETRLQLQWLSGETSDDIRYNMARVLLDPRVQNQFDRVIIDAPPRVTTGFINALCASTHLIVPFVLDTLSAERVGLFLAQLQRMSPQLFPHLKPAGVVGTMKRTDTEQVGSTEQAAFNEAKTRVGNIWGSSEYVLQQAPIPRKQCFADAAGLRSAYDDEDSEDARKIFRRLGSEIYKRAPGHAKRNAPQAAE